MKIKSLLLGATGLGLGLSAQAQTTTVDIVGATAFRAAAHQSIMASFTTLLGYAHDGAAGEGAKANRATYRGTFPGITGTTVIRVNWTGSVEGVRSLASSNATADTFLTEGAITKSGENAAKTSPTVPAKTAVMAFSDVAQSNTPYNSPTLLGGPVGIIAFAPVINKGANAAITNITTNQLRRIVFNGTIPASMLTGNASHNGTIYHVGRNDGSGTRVAFLSEIGHGGANPVKGYVINASTSKTALSNPILAPLTTNSTLYPKYSLSTDFAKTNILGNGGYSSGSAIAGWMKLPSSGNFNIVSWVGTPDAITSVNSVNGTVTGGRVLSYNGERLNGVAAGAWTEEDRNKIRLGKYAAWNFENLYYKQGISTNAKKVYDKLVATIPANLGSAGVANNTSFKVSRSTDGGIIAPK
jgi:hypothetical protein